MDPSTPLENYNLVYNGEPVVIRLITGEDVLCIAYIPKDEMDDRLLVIRPVHVSLRQVSPSPTDPTIDKALETQYRPSFSRWIAFSGNEVFPISAHNIMTIAPLSALMSALYIQWAGKLYEVPAVKTQQPITVESGPDSHTSMTDAELQALLMDFESKGKPN